MYAVIKTGGKQYRVSEGDRLRVEKLLGDVGSSLTFSEFTPKDFYAVGDKVFVLGRYAMTVKKTGKAMTSDWAHIFTISDGKVKMFREFLDTARAAEAYRG